MNFSPTGDVTATASLVDVTVPPPASPSPTSGCEAGDFAGFTVGHIAVIQRGTCTFRTKALNAEAAGASAVVIFNEGQPGRTDVVFGSLGAPGVGIPVVSTSYAVGEEIFSLAGPGVVLRVVVDAGKLGICDSPPVPGTPLPGMNVIVAEPGAVTVGTAGPDVIYGTSGPDRISALGGDDIVFGFGGDDRILGGDGADILCGGVGDDWMDGGAGADEMSGDAGNDDLLGGSGDDILADSLGTNRLMGGDGHDICNPFGTPSSQAVCEVVQGAV